MTDPMADEVLEPPEGSAEERWAAGRALRPATPRSGHADWSPGPDRPDPFEILERQAVSRVPELVPIRYARMAESPFAFFRGAAAVMAADLATTPVTGIRVQACGDAHVDNFGLFASPERKLVFDINDFDETIRGPWEWDVKRLCASLHIVARQRGFPRAARDAVVRAAACSYRERVADYATWRELDLWYERTEIKTVIERLPKRHRSSVRRDAARARRKDHLRAVGKLTEVVGGRRRFRDDPPLIVRLADTGVGLDDVLGTAERYRANLTEERRAMFDRFRLLDVAQKVVGVGSVGTRCWVALFAGTNDPDHDLIVLQVKEAQPSVLEPFVGPSGHPHEGRRVVVGQRLIQAAGDVFLGWTDAPTSGRHYYVRQLWDAKGQGDPMAMDVDQLRRHGELCAWILARSHARTGDAVRIAGYLGGATTFDGAIAAFARRYAIANEADHAAFRERVEAMSRR
ncbi:MAG TPA: DUF2252 domain-containing protein [Actinomycetota bacterium]|nr:DUF2252 domain-containing protein [Actinomycetota bacterium]